MERLDNHNVICPICHYQRKMTDVNPEWECPRCLVAYNKAVKMNKNDGDESLSAPWKQGKVKGWKYGPAFVGFGLILIALLINYQYVIKESPSKDIDAPESLLSQPGNQSIQSKTIHSKCGSRLCVEVKTRENGLIYYCKNRKSYPITVYFVFKGNNVDFYPGESVIQTIPPDMPAQIATAGIIDPKGKYHWNYHYRYRYGDMNAPPDQTVIYRLPYPIGSSYKVVQSHNGSFTHHKIYNRYAIDFNMPVGTPICAARNGYVALIRQDSDRGGNDQTYIPDGNLVVIVHDDGTVARYLHLQKNGAVVHEGDYVKQGQVIAYSGNTGYTRGAHLHFSVVKPNGNDENVSLPVSFETNHGVISFLEKNKIYTAVE